MTTSINNHSRLNRIRANAIQTRSFMDSRMIASIYHVDYYKAHLKDCIENPTTGKIAEQQYIIKKINNPEAAWINQQIMDRQPEIKPLLKELQNKIQTLYPRTAKLRDYIIKSGRLELENIKPCKHYNWFDKLKILLHH